METQQTNPKNWENWAGEGVWASAPEMSISPKGGQQPQAWHEPQRWASAPCMSRPACG